MKRLSGSAWVPIAIMVAMLAGIAELRTYSFATRVMPMAVSGSIFVLAAIQLWREIGARSRAEPGVAGHEPEGEEDGKAERHPYLAITAWLAAYALAVYLVGFYITSFVLILSYMKQHGSKWLSAVIMSVLSPAILYLVFQVALRVDLYRGLLPLLFPG